MSNLISLMPSSSARVFAISVLPTPVGPTKRRLASGLFSSRRPAFENFTAFTTCSTASSCPKIFFFILFSRLLRPLTSSVLTVSTGTRHMVVRTSFMIFLSTIWTFLSVGCSFLYAPASSIRSIALSGRYRSLIYFELI